jgi:hypothetical protein
MLRCVSCSFVIVAWCLPFRAATGQTPSSPCSEPRQLWELPPLRFRSADEIPIKPGHYRLVMHATAGVSAGETVTGIVVLSPAPANGRRPPTARVLQFVQGTTDIPLERVGIHSLFSPRPRPDQSTGALVGSFDGFKASFIIGSSATPNVPQSGGAQLDLAIADSSGVRGRWRARGGGAVPARGYFCLEPLPARLPTRRRGA